MPTKLSVPLLIALTTSGVTTTALASPRGTYIEMPPQAMALDSESEPASILYLNRFGGTYSPGHYNDSRKNVSIIPNDVSTIPTWDVTDQEWSEVYQCVRDQFARWDILVTDTDPGDANYFEALIGGNSSDVGLPPGIGGVSPFRSNCGIVDRSIVFVFAEVYADNRRGVCETIAQEVGHSLGLDHAYLCEDPMTYLGGCGAKSFQSVDTVCGEGEARSCACGASTQNSVQLLDSRLGVFGGPRFDIVSPADGQAVPSGFNIVGKATDQGGLENVSLLIDESLVESELDDNFVVKTPPLADGEHTLELVAVDTDGNVGRQRIRVTIDPTAIDPAGVADDLQVPVTCNAGGGAPGPGAFLIAVALVSLLRRRRRSC